MTQRRALEEVGRRTFLKGLAAGVVGAGIAGALPGTVSAEEGDVEGLATRVFGRTDRRVTVIGFGAGGLNTDNGRLLAAGVERGINFIDTAWRYMDGQSELEVGKFLSTYPHRERLFVNTKASAFEPPAEGTAKEIYEAFKAEVVASLERLQTDYVDGLMWPHGAKSPEELRHPAMQEALLKLREEGLVRHFGTSTHENYRATCLAAIEDGFYDHLLVVVNVCTQNKEDPDAPEKGQDLELPAAPRPAPPPQEGEKTGDAPAGQGPSTEYLPPQIIPGGSIEDTRSVLAAAQEKNIGIMAMKVAKPMFLRPDAGDLVKEKLGPTEDLTEHQRLYTYGMRAKGVHTVVVGMHAVDHVREALAIGRAG